MNGTFYAEENSNYIFKKNHKRIHFIAFVFGFSLGVFFCSSYIIIVYQENYLDLFKNNKTRSISNPLNRYLTLADKNHCNSFKFQNCFL